MAPELATTRCIASGSSLECGSRRIRFERPEQARLITGRSRRQNETSGWATNRQQLRIRRAIGALRPSRAKERCQTYGLAAFDAGRFSGRGVVVGDDTLAIAANGLNVVTDLKTVNDLRNLVAYSSGAFVPESESAYADLKADIPTTAPEAPSRSGD
jgi:hypothetical protein